MPHKWRPRPDQMPLWSYLEGGGTRAVEVAHRRWGKDDIGLHFTATQMVQRIGTYWHMLPEYGQARKAIWAAINPKTGRRRIDDAFPKEIRKTTREQEMFIESTGGSTWQLVGSDNFDSLVGSPPIGIVCSEWALADPRAWGYLEPILEENGGWALFIYTARGSGHGKRFYDFAKTADGWFAQKLTADETPVFNADQLEKIRQSLVGLYGETEGEALFQQEYYCSFEGYVPGAYYAKQMREAKLGKRIGMFPHVSGHEVYTFWDLGVNDAMAIWFMQHINQMFRFIDYYQNTGFGFAHYAKVLKEKPYVYGDHYMPHDVAVREMGGTSEIAASRKETAEMLGIKPILAVKRARDIQAVMSGIEAGRNVLSQCCFDERGCSQGLSALEAYKAEYDEEKKILSGRPKHDWTSNGADAFRTFAVGYRPPVRHRSVTELLDSMPLASGW